MKCIVCKKKITKNGDVCKECDELLDMFHKKNKRDKEITLQTLRELDKER